MATRVRSLWTSILLIGFLGLTAVLVVGRAPETSTLCGENSAIPVLPLGIQFPGFELYSYGRSDANVSPGDILCLALVWHIYYPDALANQKLLLQAVNEQNEVAVSAEVSIDPHPVSSEQEARGIQIISLVIPSDAQPGRHNLVITVLDGQGLAVSSPITISVIHITE